MEEVSGDAFAELACRLDAHENGGDLLDVLGWRGGARPTNAVALLRFAGRLEKVLLGRLPNAPGLFFCGTQSRARGRAVGGSGCGATQGEAFAKCMGELAELIAYRSDLSNRFVFGPARASGLSVFELDWCLRMLGLGPEGLDDLAWLPGRRAYGGARVRVPADLVVSREDGQNRSNHSITNSGVGAGASDDAAIERGLCEVVERDAIALWWWGNAKARPVEFDEHARKIVEDALTGLENKRRTRFWLIELTTDLDLPVIAALASDDMGRCVVVGYGADSDREAAIGAAIREMFQMAFAQVVSLANRSRAPERALAPQDLVWIEKYEKFDVRSFPALFPGAPRPAVATQTLKSRFGEIGVSPIVVDLTDRSIGVPVWRVLAPGLQPAKGPRNTERLIREMERNGRCETDFPSVPPL